jgi:hypothetical protein
VRVRVKPQYYGFDTKQLTVVSNESPLNENGNDIDHEIKRQSNRAQENKWDGRESDKKADTGLKAGGCVIQYLDTDTREVVKSVIRCCSSEKYVVGPSSAIARYLPLTANYTLALGDSGDTVHYHIGSGSADESTVADTQHRFDILGVNLPMSLPHLGLQKQPTTPIYGLYKSTLRGLGMPT